MPARKKLKQIKKHIEQEEEDEHLTNALPVSMHHFLRQTFPQNLSSEFTKTAKLDGILNRLLISQPDGVFDDRDLRNNYLADVKVRLKAPFSELNGDLSQYQQVLYSYINEYRDIFYFNDDYKLSSVRNDIERSNSIDGREGEIRRLLCLHALNHVFKTRDFIIKNNEKVKAATAETEPSANLDDEFRDQGFTRPKVLIVAPFRNDAYKFIQDIIKISGSTELERFFEEFGPGSSNPDPRKSDDFNRTFEGNIDDCFKIGLKFSRKEIKLYSNFASSDILVVSPLGLKLIIGEKGDKKRDFDYLSSIENWEHFKSIVDHLNLIPSSANGCDFSRVKNYVLDGNAKLVRQTILFSDFQTPEINAFLKTTANISGSVHITYESLGKISQVVKPIPQIFTRISLKNIQDLNDARFSNFTQNILPNIIHKRSVLLFVPSYFDYVRIRNYLTNNNYSFEGISEYTSKSNVDRSRHLFKTDQVQMLVYTERTHFFRRYKIECSSLIFYAPPLNPELFTDMVNQTLESCRVYWSIYDKFSVERIVGNSRAGKMIKSEKNEYMFTI